MLSTFKSFVTFLLLVTSSLAAYHIRSGSKVVDLSSADILNRSHALYKGAAWWLVKFYKPDCGASLRLAPEWEEFALDQLDDQAFVVARFNCYADQKSTQICKNQNKLYFPDITLYRHGQFVGQLPFKTDANVADILNWALPLKRRVTEEFDKVGIKETKRKQRNADLWTSLQDKFRDSDKERIFNVQTQEEQGRLSLQIVNKQP